MTQCQSCKQLKPQVSAALVGGKYYKAVCDVCLNGSNDTLSNGAASFDRRRGYEDNAQDTVQPFNAIGPNVEFYRLYPEAAKKVFTKQQIEQIKKKI